MIGERFRKRDLEAVYPIKEEVVAVKVNPYIRPTIHIY